MHDEETDDTGLLYRLADGACIDSGLSPVKITNGPALSPDGTLLFHTDTVGRTIWRMRVSANGALASPELFVRIEEHAGYPDGAVVDSEGCLWIGLFGGWGVRRYDPAGWLLRSVPFPVANVTKIAFGGDNLRTAFATTARKGLSPKELRAQPHAGDLFCFDPGVAGVAIQPVTGLDAGRHYSSTLDDAGCYR